jgi:hypothetical protein
MIYESGSDIMLLMEDALEPLDGEDEMSPERAAQIRQLQAWLKEYPYGEQDENGVDISLLRENLKLTPRERLNKLQNLVRGIPINATKIINS